ncbi:unnamed protein product [Closterium sp. NIES-54]
MANESRRRVTTRCVSLWRKAKSAALGKGTAAASSERDAGEPANHADGRPADGSSDAAHPVANPPCELSPVACDVAEDPLASPPTQGVFENLSIDCLEVIFRRLTDACDAVRASCVCKAWHSAFHGSTRHVSLHLDPVMLQWQPSFRPVYAHLDTVTSALTGMSGEGGMAANDNSIPFGGEMSSSGGGWTGASTVGVADGAGGAGGVAGWWWDPTASGGWHVNHTDRFDCNSLARPGWMAHEPYHRSFSPNLIRALLQQFPNLTSACLPVTVRGSEATDMQPVVTTLASCSALRSLHMQVNAGQRASGPPAQLDLTAHVAALLSALPSLRALSLQSAHCFLRPSPPLLAAFARLHHLALPVHHLPAPLLALTRLSSLALAVLCPPCPTLLASPAPFHRLTRLSSLALHLGASVDCHPCPMCTISDTADGSTSGSSSSDGSGGGDAGGGSSASTATPSTSLAPLSPLSHLFSGLSPSLTSLTYTPPSFPPPAPTSLPPSLITLTALRTLRLLPPTAATTAHFWGDLDGLSRLTQLTFLELSCVAGNAVPASLQGMPLLAHVVLPWAQSDPARVLRSLSALRELEIGTGALRIEPQVEAATAGQAGQAGQAGHAGQGAARAESTPNPPTSNTIYALSEPCQPTATVAAPPLLLPPSLTSLRLLHTDHRPLHLPALACPLLRRLSFSFNVELAARVPPHACFFPNLQFLELFRVEGSFGWGNGQWLGAMPSLTHFISRCPKRNHSYLLHRLAPSLKFLHLEDPSPKVPLVVLPSLTSLTIDKYCDVSALLSSLSAFSALHTLRFNCFSQVAADRKLSPGRVGRPPALRVLQFRFAQIHALPEFVRGFTSVVRVDLINCGPLEVWPEFLAKFPAFHCLRVSGCSKLPPPPPSLVPLLVLPREGVGLWQGSWQLNGANEVNVPWQ